MSDKSDRNLLDLVVALAPVAVLLAIQYRDEIQRAGMWIDMKLNPARWSEAEALRQTQREISWMEHGVGEDAN